MSARHVSVADRAICWLATGPVGRVAAFAGDLGYHWWRWARARLRGRPAF